MSYWDSSALVKLYVQELDSAEFRELAVKASRVATGSIVRGGSCARLGGTAAFAFLFVQLTT